ncbi:MAG: KR domain-containing protein [Acetobacteraceae bacterium]|nr:KR domain-containing protein [Acetobacteraceae bacterium]
MAASVAAGLRSHGLTPVTCSPDSPALGDVLAGGGRSRAVLFVPPDLPDELGETGPESARPGVQQLLALSHLHARRNALSGARLYVVTRRVHAVGSEEATRVTDAGISGLAATLFNEFPALRCTRIDVAPENAEQAGADVAREVLADTGDDWVAYHDARRFVARLRKQHVSFPPAPAEDEIIRLVSEGGLDGLAWRPAGKRTPGAHEVEIAVRAAALNFRDVVSVVGLFADDQPLGRECAGVVTRVGEAVSRFRPGDAVIAIASGSFATSVLAEERLTVRKPDAMPFAVAAGQGLVYLTADYCLDAVARVRPGERVLVHAAAGGVGLAAVALCLRRGAEVYATAGSEEKRNYLRERGVRHVFSSRSLDFAAEIARLHGEPAIDVVLNALSGPFVDAGLSLLRPGGRFVEIGKTDIRDPETVAAAWPGIRYVAVDLTDRLREQPDATMARLDELLQEMVAGDIEPVPHRPYEFAACEMAFRDLASGRNTGKLVLTAPDQAKLIRPGMTYIVTGGTAGLGFRMAEWLAEGRAGRVLLLGRRPPAPDVATRIAAWRAKGVDMRAVQGDAGSYETVAALVGEAGDSLRGVIHCANALDDAPVGELTWDRFATAMHPKAGGAWNLHRATAKLPLDFFLLFSSFAALAGTRGGANYAAANIALDSIAHLRRAHGLPALSVNWGAWADIGWAARTAAGSAAGRGFDALPPERAIAALERALQSNGAAQLAIASVRWPVLADAAGPHGASLFSEIITPDDARSSRGATGDDATLAETIAAAPPESVRAEVVCYLQSLAARALGFDDAARIDPDQPLQDMGMDSILAVDLRNTLARSLRADIPAAILFDYPTVNSLADYSIGLLSPEPPQYSTGIHEKDDDLLALIEGLSDEEVDERLLGKSAEAVL